LRLKYAGGFRCAELAEVLVERWRVGIDGSITNDENRLGFWFTNQSREEALLLAFDVDGSHSR